MPIQQQIQKTESLEKASALIAEARIPKYEFCTPEQFARIHALLAEALALIEDTGDPTLEAYCVRTLAAVYKNEGDWAKAVECYEKAARLYETVDDIEGRLLNLRLLSALNYDQGDYAKALQYALEGLNVAAAPEVASWRCSIYLQLGNIYRDMERYEEASDACRNGIELARILGEPESETICLGNLAQALGCQGRYEEALTAARESLEISRAVEDPFCVYAALVCLGRAYVQAGRSAEAIPLYREAADVPDLDLPAQCALQTLLGEALLETGDLAEARSSLDCALALSSSINLTRDACRCRIALSRIDENDGDYLGALAHYEIFHALYSRLFNEDSEKKIHTLIGQWQIEKAQQEAEIHRLKNVELIAANEAFEKANVQLHDQAEELQAQAEEVEMQAEELERLATLDGLTGLHNRRYLEDWLSLQFARVQRYGTPLTVAMIDVDRFKRINDTYGHQTGDHVLAIVARIMASACRSADLLARYGGEEFTIVLPETTIERAWNLCERIRQLVEAYAWSEIHVDLAVTISIGMSDDVSVSTYEQLLAEADRQLYLVKHNGRNCVLPKIDLSREARSTEERSPQC